MRKHLWLAVLAATVAQPAAAQQSGGDVAAELKRSFTDVSSWVTQAAELVPDDEYGYRPVESVRTFGELIGHIADAYNYYCALAAGEAVEWSDPIEKGSTGKAMLTQKLAEALAGCNAALAGTGEPGPLLDNVAHTSLHYGNIVTYMRMLGLVPPSS